MCVYMYVFVCHLGMRMFPDTCPHMMLAEARVHTDFTYTCEQQPVPVDGVSLPISELVQQWLRLREGEKYGVPKPAEKNTTIGHLLTSLQSNIQGVFFCAQGAILVNQVSEKNMILMINL